MHPLLHQAHFLKGAVRPSQFPQASAFEVAFAGRSNAGKSSALNVITRQRSLARTSKTPGRTREINFFQLDEQRYLVDLPGYGFAKVSASMRNQWRTLIGGYLEQREALQGLVIIMDVRRPFTDYDLQLLDWCVDAGLPVHLLLTKADKLSRGAAKQTLLKAKKWLDEEYDRSSGITAQLFSALKKDGVDMLETRLLSWLQPQADTGNKTRGIKKDE